MKKLKILSAFCLMICLSFLLAACGSSPVKFKIEFMVDNAVYSTIDTSGNEVISMPTDPTKDGFTFDGWYWDNNSWQRPFTASSLLNEPLSSNMKVYVKWNAEDSLEGTQARFDGFTMVNAFTYSITVSNSTELINFSDIVEVNNKSSWKLATDIQANNTVASKIATLNAGNNTYYVLVTAENENVKLYTLNIRRKPLYLVTFNTNGGTTITSQNIEEDLFANLPTQPTKTGYSFVNWNYDFSTAITSPTTITANWRANTYKVNYFANNGTSDNQEQNAVFNSSVTLKGSTAFTKTTYDLVRWNTEANGNGTNYAINFNFAYYNIAENLDLYAIWQPTTYTINYHLDGGTNGYNPRPDNINYRVDGGTNGDNPASYNVESDTITLINPTKTSYVFTGWFTESTFENKITEIVKGSYENLTLYARWAATITFDSNGGTAVSSITKNYGESIIMPIPTRELYRFYGWQLNGIDYNFTTMPNTNTTLIAVWEPFNDGFGTQESPYIISTAEQLILLSTLVNTGNNYSLNKYFVLENDIDLSEMEWTPIGYLYSTYSNYTRAFQGNFNGNGFKIYNFNITKNNHISSYNNRTYTGIFGYCYNGIILNLGAEDFNIRTTYITSYSTYAGGLVGYNYSGTIENCYATGDVSSSSSFSDSFSYAGGLVGLNSGTIENCYATGDVSYSSSSYYSYAGGLVGDNSGTIVNCYATGDVSSSSYAGGLVGRNSGTIENCYATGDVSYSSSSSSSSYAGGLVGRNSGTIENCYRYIGQRLYRKSGSSEYTIPGNSTGTERTLEQLNLTSFYLDDLGWSEDVWNFTDLDFEQGKYPILKAI